jgi:Fe-S cluster biogenesis protein NfuA/nitrite reductase/ring-hydroxylating ferredoxin subunit
MGVPSTTDESAALLERVQELQDALERGEDSPTRELAEELVAAIVQMYGAGLERIVSELLASGAEGERIAAEVAQDPLVATLLLIHDLHPIGLEQRVQAALDSVRPYMDSHGGDVELLSLSDGIARIRLQGSCSDCSASSVTLELAIKQALEDAAPDLEGLEVEGVAPQLTGLALPMADGQGSELPIVMSPAGAPEASALPTAQPAWFDLDPVEPAEGTLAAVNVAGNELVVANVDGTLLAYRDACAQCGAPLRDGNLASGALRCAACERSFYLPRAGRSMDDDRLQLEPVPLLREQGRVKVALAG